MKILLVEDNAMVSELMEELLSTMGHGVCAVETTEAGAIAAAARWTPDLMIVDLQLRIGSGATAMAAILATGYVPHLFVSGDAGAFRATHPRAIILEKPFNEAGLSRAIRRASEPQAPRPGGSP